MKLTACLLAVLVGAAFAFGSGYGPRLSVLTGDARLLLDDYNEIWAYPGTMAKYQFGIVTSEYSSGEPSTDDWGLGWFGGVMEIDGATWGATHNHGGDLLEVLYHGGNFGLIVGLDFSSNVAVGTDTQDELGFNAAFGTEIDLFGDYTDLSIGGGYGSVEVTSGDTASTTTLKSTDLMIGASMRGHTDGLFNLFPIISAGFNQYKMESTMGETSSDNTASTITADFGAGINKMFTETTQFVGGVFIGLSNTSYSVSEGDAPDSEMDIQIAHFKVGVDQHLTNWLVLRGGANSSTHYNKIGDGDAVISTSIDSRFGLGFEVGPFTLNANISQSFLHNGPYLVGGVATGFLSDLACIYEF